MSGISKYQQFFERFQPDSRVLDVGCGVGDLTARIARKVPQGFVLGTDLQCGDLTRAARRYPCARFPNLRFLCADARTLRLPEEPFDFAVSRCCLHFVRWPGNSFPAIARNLKTGGCMHVWFYGYGHCLQIEDCLRTLSSRMEWFPYFRNFQPSWYFVSPAACQPWLCQAGFVARQLELQEDTVNFPNREVFLQWLRWAWGSYWERVPQSRLAAFQDSFLELYGDTKSYRARKVWLVVEAVKK